MKNFVEKYESYLYNRDEMKDQEIQQAYLWIGANEGNYYDTQNGNKPVCCECACASGHAYFMDCNHDRRPNDRDILYFPIEKDEGEKHACWSCVQGLDETYTQLTTD